MGLSLFPFQTKFFDGPAFQDTLIWSGNCCEIFRSRLPRGQRQSWSVDGFPASVHLPTLVFPLITFLIWSGAPSLQASLQEYCLEVCYLKQFYSFVSGKILGDRSLFLEGGWSCYRAKAQLYRLRGCLHDRRQGKTGVWDGGWAKVDRQTFQLDLMASQLGMSDEAVFHEIISHLLKRVPFCWLHLIEAEVCFKLCFWWGPDKYHLIEGLSGHSVGLLLGPPGPLPGGLLVKP